MAEGAQPAKPKHSNSTAATDGTDREFRNVSFQRYMDAGDLPKGYQITTNTK